MPITTRCQKISSGKTAVGIRELPCLPFTPSTTRASSGKERERWRRKQWRRPRAARSSESWAMTRNLAGRSPVAPACSRAFGSCQTRPLGHEPVVTSPLCIPPTSSLLSACQLPRCLPWPPSPLSICPLLSPSSRSSPMPPSRLYALYNDLSAAYPPIFVELVGTFIVQAAFFWLPCIFFLCGDYLLPASVTRAYKTQPAQAPPSAHDLRHCITRVLLNQLLVYVLQGTVHLLLPRVPYTAGPPPTRLELVRDLALQLVCCEILFYALHRALHRPALYRCIHKTHHSFTAPVALAAQYAHPLEHIMTYYVPVFVPAAAARVHLISLWVFVASVCFESCVVHSGYRAGRLAERHDRHHERGSGGYGTFDLLDRLCGTELDKVGGRGGRGSRRGAVKLQG